MIVHFFRSTETFTFLASDQFCMGACGNEAYLKSKDVVWWIEYGIISDSEELKNSLCLKVSQISDLSEGILNYFTGFQNSIVPKLFVFL